MNTVEERLAAHRAAMAQPFRVQAWRAWNEPISIAVGFQNEAEARRFASLRPEPLIDLSAREDHNGIPTGGGNMIGVRRLVPHPAMNGRVFTPRDDFPDERD